MNRVLELDLTQMAHGGEALGRAPDGRVVFVGYALPGERVRARLTDVRKRWARGVAEAVLRPSPDRVEPPCPHFGPQACGGCQWQHAAYEAQLRYKTAIVREQLRRLGKLDDGAVRPCIGMAEPWHYRNHVQLRVDEAGRLGFVRADGQGIEPIETCLIMNPAVHDLFHQLEADFPALRRVALRGSTRTGDRMVILETDEDEPPEVEVDFPVSVVLVLGDGTPVTLVGSPYIYEEVAGRRWRVSATSFFQVNTEMADRLVELVREAAAPLYGIETVIDAYAGVGTLGISLAPDAGHVILVEANPVAVEDARANAADGDNVSWVEGATEEVLPAWEGPRPDLVVLDPPRAGCAPAVLEALTALRPKKIVYVSCDTATLARDLGRLVRGGFALRWVQPLDMFPQTYHVETVTLLEWDG